MPEIFAVEASDLVLRVSENVDIAKFDISKYKAFLDVLYFAREFEWVIKIRHGTAYNRAYLASCLQHSVQVPLRGTSDTLGTLDVMPKGG